MDPAALSGGGGGINTNCKPGSCTNYTRKGNWNQVSAPASPPRGLGQYITGVRYAWSASPCCPFVDRNGGFPCSVGACPIRGWNSTLPANPFYADVVGGKCVCTPPQKCS